MQRQLNILISSFGYVEGPGYQRTFKIAVELVQLGHEVTFLTSQLKSRKFPYSVNYKKGVKEVAFFDPSPKKIKKIGLSLFAAILKSIYILNKNFDVVHADTGHRISSGVPCWLHKFLYKSKYISEWWDFYGKGGQYENKPLLWKFTYGPIDNWLEIFDKKRADGVIALSEFTRQRVLNLCPGYKNTTVVHGGADIADIDYIADFRYRGQYNLKSDDFVIVMVGVVGIDDFGKLIHLTDECVESNKIKIVTTGRIIENEILIKHGLSNVVYQLGWVDYKDYDKILSLADIFYLYQPEDNLNRAKWPNKIGDYLCAGRVIITTPVNDVVIFKKSLSENTPSIIFVEADNNNINEILSTLYSNRSNLLAIGSYNRKLAFDNSWNSKAKQIEIFYFDTLID